MIKRNLLLLIIFLLPSYIFAENEIVLYLNNGEQIVAELNSISENSFIMIKENFNEDDDTIKVRKNDIKKIIIPDSSILSASEIEIHTKDSIKEDIVLKGIDLENNLIYFSEYDSFDDEIGRSDTLNLADTNLVQIIVFGKSNVVTGLFAGTGIGLVGGALTGGIIAASTITTDAFIVLIGILGGGISGGAVGLLVGTIAGIASSSGDMIIDNKGNFKSELLNFIQYPNLIYKSEELE